jgi:hypothetical protein
MVSWLTGWRIDRRFVSHVTPCHVDRPTVEARSNRLIRGFLELRNSDGIRGQSLFQGVPGGQIRYCSP